MDDPLPFGLHVFLAKKLKLPVETISKKSIAAALDKSGVPVAESLAIQKLLDDVALQLYTPSTDESKTQEFFVEAVRLVKTL